MTRPLIVFFTDFGHEGPYLGQMSAVLRREAPEAEVINLFAEDASWNNWQGYLLGPLGLGGKDGAAAGAQAPEGGFELAGVARRPAIPGRTGR